MSTFAVFGMTRDVALAEVKKRTKGTSKNVKAPGGVEPIPLAEWMDGWMDNDIMSTLAGCENSKCAHPEVLIAERLGMTAVSSG